MLELYDTKRIEGIFLAYFINADPSGMEDEEIEKADNFYNALSCNGKYYVTFDVKDEESQFGTDAVTGLLADVYEVDIYRDEII